MNKISIKKRVLIYIKKKISFIRNDYNALKNSLTNFLKKDLSYELTTDKGISYMQELGVSTEEELKLKALNIYYELFTEEEYYTWNNFIKNTYKKGLQKNITI